MDGYLPTCALAMLLKKKWKKKQNKNKSPLLPIEKKGEVCLMMKISIFIIIPPSLSLLPCFLTSLPFCCLYFCRPVRFTKSPRS